MTTVLLILAAVAAFALLVFALIDREALGWGRPTPPAQPAPATYRGNPRGFSRSESESGGETLIIIGLTAIMLIGVSWFVVSGLGYVRSLSLAQRSESLPTVSGEVVSAEVGRVRGRRGSTGGWRPVVTYSYVVDGRTYTNNVWRAHPRYVVDRATAEQIVARHRAGYRVTVMYDPANPQRAALRNGYVTWFDYVAALSVLVFCVLAVLFVLVCLASLLPGAHKPADLQQEQRELMRELMRRRAPRAVQARELIPLFYRPWLHVTCLVAAGASTWLLLAPLTVLPHTWVLFGSAALGLGILLLWPLATLRATLWALRNGYDGSAFITEYYLNTFRGGSEAQVRWRVQGPTGEFDGRYKIQENGHKDLREGRVVRVIVHPSRPKVLRVVDL